MANKNLKTAAIELIEKNLNKYFNTDFQNASYEQVFKAVASAAMDELYNIRMRAKTTLGPKTKVKKPIKTLHYLSIEILPGKSLKNTLFNLGWDTAFTAALAGKGIDITKIYALESDAGLGNGGLGRLAACYMDSLATLNYPATAHCIKYDFGFFKQRIVDGQQVEVLDDWLHNGSVWLTARPDEAVTVRFNGTVAAYKGKDGKLKFSYENSQAVEAIPYDMLLSGYNARVISNLKLWSAKNRVRGDIHLSRADYADYVKESQEIESINSVLYPSNDHFYGQNLRLRQQYFLCSASMQSIVNTCVKKGYALKELPAYVSIHINDTHPAMSVPELMRILMDEQGLSWDDAWSIVTKCMSYTNHTVVPESLECWDNDLIMRTIPRIHQIICEIDRRTKKAPKCTESMHIISGNRIRMANLAIHASYRVNGVSQIHSGILRDKLFKGFALAAPEKFINITNGVIHRRWLVENNPAMTKLITSLIGNDWRTEAAHLNQLLLFAGDTAVLKKVNQIKLENKRAFADFLKKSQGIEINPETRFDVLIKRIHEYKRQLLNVLRIIHIFNVLRCNPNADITPQTFIFAGKAASSYHIAKRIIKLINQLGAEIDKHPRIRQIIKVVFVENFSVTISEKLVPAIDVSQQISLAGWEASGTGNMKAVMNGGIMMCTYDGANAEIHHHCGPDGNFMFGLLPSEVEQCWQDGYYPIDIYNQNLKIVGVIDALNQGFNGESFRDIASYLLCTAHQNDGYMCLMDFEGFLDAHDRMDALYRDPIKWARTCLGNIANMGFFSSDRAIEEYVKNVWQLTKLK